MWPMGFQELKPSVCNASIQRYKMFQYDIYIYMYLLLHKPVEEHIMLQKPIMQHY